MKRPTLTLQKSPPTPRYGFTPFCRNERPTLPTLPSSFGRLVSSAKSTISLRGRISSAFPLRTMPHSLPLQPLLGVTLQPPHQTINDPLALCHGLCSYPGTLMTAYNLKPPETLPSPAWQEAREKRRTYLQQSADDEQ